MPSLTRSARRVRPRSGPARQSVVPGAASPGDPSSGAWSADGWAPRAWSPRIRTLLLSATLVATLAVLPLLDMADPLPGAPSVPLLVLVVMFAVGGQLLAFNVEIRGQVQSHTLSDLPLVIGLFLVPPSQLIAARLIGEVVAALVRRRQSPLKIMLNSSLLVAECILALAVFHVAFGGPDARTPLGWLAALVSVAAMDYFSIAVVSTVIRWHSGESRSRDVLFTASGSALANVSLGITATLLLYQHSAAVLLLVAITGVLFVGCRAYTALHQRYTSLQLLHDFSEAIGGALRADDVVEEMLRYARRLLRADVAELIVFGERGEPPLRSTLRGDAPLVEGPPGDLSALMAASEAGRCVVVPRASRGPLSEYFVAAGARDGICAPLRLGDGVRGAFLVADRALEITTFEEDDARIFQTLANHAAMALEKGRLIEKLRAEAARREYQALHDHLTGLPNRAMFLESAARRIEAAEAAGRSVAVLIMDLDLFKEINDTLGHHTGDLLLQEIADRLRRVLRHDDVAARLGGDEFALVVECVGADDAVAIARRVLQAVQEPVDLSQLLIDVRASIGIAMWPDDGDDVATLLQRADVAMYVAKAAKSGVECYRAEVDHNTPRRLMLAAELRRGIAEGQLSVHYQPKADLRSGKITGAEALVRWRHPELGNIPPDEFIPIAEQTGLIAPLTSFVLGEALAQCRAWNDAGLDLGVAVNVAARSVGDPAFTDLVFAMLERTRVPGTRLTLEITESSIMSDTHRSIDALHELAALGIRLSVDDFGTGYSSLSYLQRLPVHELKVDRSFVFNVGEDENDRAIVRSIVELGHGLGLQVVAEGVENQLAWDRLLEMRCDIAQGYFLSRPLPPADLTDWLLRTVQRSTDDAGEPVGASGPLATSVIAGP